MKAIEINGEVKLFSKYPKNFKHEGFVWALLDDKQAAKIGFKDVVTPEHDGRIEELSAIYLDGDVYTYDVIEKPIKETLADLKDQRISSLRLTISSELSATDWYVIREADSGEAMPKSIKDERAALRKQSNDLEAKINALTSKKAVVLFDTNI